MLVRQDRQVEISIPLQKNGPGRALSMSGNTRMNPEVHRAGDPAPGI